MSKHLAGLGGVVVAIVVLAIMGLIVDNMLKAIPHTSQRPYPKEVHVGLVPTTPPAPPDTVPAAP
ncbi:MAG TPA: hypothetical protein VL026_02565 [Rhizomicrobium sp.]|nr:hypothetical protein [Rhizomicrobium sp.]